MTLTILMEKISQHLSKEFSIVRLYLDDLEAINEILSQMEGSVTWTTETYKFDSLNELLDNYKLPAIHKLVIESRVPYVTIELRHFRSTVTVVSYEPRDEGIFTQLNKILQNSQSKYQYLFSTKFFWILMIIFFLALYGIEPEIHPGIYGTYLALAFSLSFYGGWIKAYKNTKIKLINRHEEKNFWARNKDQIILIVIGALLGSLLTYLIQLISGK